MDKCIELSRNPHFVANLPTAIYVHGFHTNQSAPELKELVENFVLHNRLFNMITLDWDHFAYLPYYGVASPLAAVVRSMNMSNEFGNLKFGLRDPSMANGLAKFYIIAVLDVMEF